MQRLARPKELAAGEASGVSPYAARDCETPARNANVPAWRKLRRDVSTGVVINADCSR